VTRLPGTFHPTVPVKKNLYDILGVARDADANTIRKAYRKLARQHHPDVNPGDSAAEERFKEISHAYSVLSDAEKRSHYDEFGDVALEGGFDAEAARRAREAFGARFGGPEFEGGGAEFHFGDLDDLLGGVFSRFGREGGRPPRPRRGRDLEASITLGFLDAARGGEHRLSLARPTADGGVTQEQITVRTPPGVRDGGRIRLAGKGGEVAGGPPGDLYLNVHVQAHPIFRREDRDVHLEVPISVAEAVRGAKVEIPTLDGRATVTIPRGTDSGRKLRLRGKGLANPAGGPPGDLIATVRIRVPQKVDEAAEKALDELARHDPPDLREELFR
jgi:curved DNA-binding protein